MNRSAFDVALAAGEKQERLFAAIFDGPVAYVQKAAQSGTLVLGKADLEDQRWLDQRLEAIDDGIDAVLDIARNWTDLRNLSRLHPGTSAQDYILLRVKHPLGRGVVVPLLAESNWSNRQIAAVAGVSEGTVRNDELRNLAQLPERPAETLGADGKLRPAWAPSPGLMSSDSPKWYTPKHIVAAVVSALDGIDLDPCADPDRSVPAAAHYTERDDGLAQEWRGTVYMNPPYGRPIVAWVGKLVAEYRAERVTAAVALIPARTETDWWAAFDAQLVCFIHGRLAFSGQETSAPFPSAAIYLGSNEQDFVDAFAPLGEVYRRVP